MQFEVTGAPGVIGQPVPQPVVAGSQAVFAGTVGGESPLHFQWRFNTRDLAGATNHALVISNVTSADVGEYSLLVSNHLGHTRSVEARLHLILPPVFRHQPADLAAATGGYAAFRAVVGDDFGVSYQWQRDGQNISGATNSVLEILPVVARDEGVYRVKVWSDAGTNLSSAAALAVVDTAPRIFPELAPPTARAGQDLTLAISVQSEGPFNIQWLHDNVPLSGGTNASLALTNIQVAAAGEYSVQITNLCCQISSPITTLTIAASAPSLIVQPEHRNVPIGGTFTLMVMARGSEPFRYQWLLDGRALTGEANQTLTFANARPEQSGSYSVVIENTSGAVTSAVARVAIFSFPLLQIKRSSTNALSITASASGPVQFESSADLARWEPVGGAFSNALPVVPTIDRWRFFRAWLK